MSSTIDFKHDVLYIFLISVLAGLLGASLLSGRSFGTSSVDHPAIFSELFDRCARYVEGSTDFDSEGLIEGDVRAERPTGSAHKPAYSLWHHAEALFVVSVKDNPNSGTEINPRICDVGVSSNGKRPPLSVLPEVLYEYVSLRREKLRTDAYAQYHLPYYAPESFAFRSSSVDDRG